MGSKKNKKYLNKSRKKKCAHRGGRSVTKQPYNNYSANRAMISSPNFVTKLKTDQLLTKGLTEKEKENEKILMRNMMYVELIPQVSQTPIISLEDIIPVVDDYNEMFGNIYKSSVDDYIEIFEQISLNSDNEEEEKEKEKEVPLIQSGGAMHTFRDDIKTFQFA